MLCNVQKNFFINLNKKRFSFYFSFFKTNIFFLFKYQTEDRSTGFYVYIDLHEYSQQLEKKQRRFFQKFQELILNRKLYSISGESSFWIEIEFHFSFLCLLVVRDGFMLEFIFVKMCKFMFAITFSLSQSICLITILFLFSFLYPVLLFIQKKSKNNNSTKLKGKNFKSVIIDEKIEH